MWLSGLVFAVTDPICARELIMSHLNHPMENDAVRLIEF